MAGIITATGAAEWLRVSRLELLSSADAACWLRISITAFYAGPAKRLPVIRPAGPRSNAVKHLFERFSRFFVAEVAKTFGHSVQTAESLGYKMLNGVDRRVGRGLTVFYYVPKELA